MTSKISDLKIEDRAILQAWAQCMEMSDKMTIENGDIITSTGNLENHGNAAVQSLEKDCSDLEAELNQAVEMLKQAREVEKGLAGKTDAALDEEIKRAGKDTEELTDVLKAEAEREMRLEERTKVNNCKLGGRFYEI